MEKLKSQASVLAEKAQETAKAGQDRISQMQAKRQADALLLELGGITYQSRTGRSQAGADARADEIVTKLQSHEAENGPINVTSATAAPPASGTYVPGGSGGAGPSAASASAATPGPSTPPGPTGASSGATGGIPTPSHRSDEEDAPE
jgi:hypothetical protein